MNIQPAILAGGAGTRLWPLSRSTHPKQFLLLLEGSTLLDTTLERMKGRFKEDDIVRFEDVYNRDKS